MTEAATLTSGLALMFGIFHALEPGHGKTALMTYLASGKRTITEGLVIALTSALTHSLAVLFIAIGSHYLLQHSTTEHSVHMVGEILALVSGALIVGLGVWIIRKGWLKEPVHTCSSCGGHHKHDHDHAHDHHHHHAKVRRHGLFASGLLGVATGMIPCPTIVVAYLSGLSTGNSYLGMQNVLLFALGMSLSLMAVIVLFSMGALKVREKIKPNSFSFNWYYLQGSVFVLIGLFTAFYH